MDGKNTRMTKSVTRIDNSMSTINNILEAFKKVVKICYDLNNVNAVF